MARSYAPSAGAFLGYMGAKRKQLVEKYGYDVKNASQLIRLLHMGEEYQRTGKLYVRRTWDRNTLISIKRGEWSLTRVQTHAESCLINMKHALENSVLPETVDVAVIEELTVSIMLEWLRGSGQLAVSLPSP